MTTPRTRDYVQGRFGDYYSTITLQDPPNDDAREWGLTRWQEGDDGITEEFTRHLSIFEIGDITERAVADRPLHMYISTAEYENPTSMEVDEKGWLGADITFFIELDTLVDDHQSTTDSETDDTPQPRPQFDTCKTELQVLLDRLDDFHIEDLQVVFTGEGFRVQIQDENYRQLRESERAELLEYVTTTDFDPELFDPTRNAEPTITDALAQYTGGWRRDLHEELLNFLGEIDQLDEQEQKERLEQIPQIGPTYSKQIQNPLSSNSAGLIEAGRGDKYSAGLNRLLKQKLGEFAEPHRAAINSTQTTNLHAFVRLPHTLNGNTGLKVTPIEPNEIKQFDPTIDPVPEEFRGTEIEVQVTGPGVFDFGNETFDLDEGVYSVPEPFGIYLMLQGRAQPETI